MILPQQYSIDLVAKILDQSSIISYDSDSVQLTNHEMIKFLNQTTKNIYGFNVILGHKSPIPIKNLNDYETNQLEQLLRCDSTDSLDPQLSKITLFVLINNLVQQSGVSNLVVDQLIQLYNDSRPLQLPASGYNTQYFDGSMNWAILKNLSKFQSYDRIITIQMKSISFATILYYTYRSLKCIQMCFKTTAISFEASNGVICAFTNLVNEVKMHEGQQEVAEELYKLLTVDDEQSDLNTSLKSVTHNILQDAYSTRCIPQVVGACLDQVKFAKNWIQSQPPQQGFQLTSHGIVITGQNNNEAELLIADYLSIAISEMGAITERRIQRLMNPKLTKLQNYYHEYLRDENSLFGYQNLANKASNLIQQNKKYCHPVSADSMPQTTYLEDINSNFEDSILKLFKILNNTIQILAIDLFISSRIIVHLESQEKQQIHQKLQAIVSKIISMNDFDYASSLGFIQFWGLSRQLNLITPQHTGKVNILLSGVSDIRHLMETCLCNFNRDDLELNFYVHETSKEPICRSLLLLLVLHTNNFTYRERSDMFLEIFGNTFLRDSTCNYIDKVIPFLDDLIAKETKFTSALNQIVDLRELRFKDRDEMTEIIRSWYSYQEFKIEKLRDQRLRHLYGIRYDHRLNLVDWDYQMNLKDQAPIIHFIHYREWRQSGVAFESRFASYPNPNRTLASYLPGKNKQTKDNLLVRGYWGDVVVSPYISFGISTSVKPENESLFKIRNTQQVSHAVTVSEFNIQHMIQKFDGQNDYHISVDEYLERTDNKKQEKLEQIDEKEEQDEKDEKEVQQQEEQINEPVQQVITKDNLVVNIQLEPLQVFQKLKVKIIPIFEEFDKLYGKKKFTHIFDIGVLGFMDSIKVRDPQLKKLFKEQSTLFVESSKFIVPFNKEERIKANENVAKIGVTDGGWLLQENNTEYITFIQK